MKIITIPKTWPSRFSIFSDLKTPDFDMDKKSTPKKQPNIQISYFLVIFSFNKMYARIPVQKGDVLYMICRMKSGKISTE